MAAVVVTPVKSWGDRGQFLNVPERLYKGDPYWIPRLRIIERELAGYPHHPFHETAEVQTFLARRGGEVCGRVAAIVNHEHNREHNEQRGFFGFFETVDDAAVSNALLDAVRDGWRCGNHEDARAGESFDELRSRCSSRGWTRRRPS